MSSGYYQADPDAKARKDGRATIFLDERDARSHDGVVGCKRLWSNAWSFVIYICRTVTQVTSGMSRREMQDVASVRELIWNGVWKNATADSCRRIVFMITDL